MKHHRFVIAALMHILVAGTAMAADTATVTVTATVQGTCKFNPAAQTPTLAFGTLTPDVAAGNVTGSTSLTYWCTKGVTPLWTVQAAQPLPYTGTIPGVTAGNTDVIRYTIDSVTVSGPSLGPGTTRTATVNGTIYANGANGYNLATADGYSGTFVMELNP